MDRDYLNRLSTEQRSEEQAQDSSSCIVLERRGKKRRHTSAPRSSDSMDRTSENLRQDFALVMPQQMQTVLPQQERQQQQQYQQMQRQQERQRQQQQIERAKLKQMQSQRQGAQRRLLQAAPCCLQGQQTQKSSISSMSCSPDARNVHRSTNPTDIDSSKCFQEKGYFATSPSSPQVEHENSSSENVAHLRKTISDLRNTIIQHQVKGNTAKMLILRPTGEQRLITFDIPDEDCTIYDLLEEAHITFDSDITVSLVDDPALGINYIVEVGDALGSWYDIAD